MRAVLSGAIAAIEGVAAALTTLLIVTGLAFLVWWLSFDLSSEPLEVLQLAGSAWLLANFVPLSLDLSAETMQALGFAGEPLSFALSLAPLGVTFVTVVFAIRSGWRFGGRGGSGVAGVIGGALGFGAVAGVVDTYVSISALPIALTALIPALVYAVSSAVAFVARAATEQHVWWDHVWSTVEVWLGKIRVPKPRVVRQRAADAMRLTGMLLAGYVGLAAVGVVAAIVVGYANIISTSQALQLDLWGEIMVFVLHLAFLPTLVIWGGSWFTGAGFAVGQGSSASPFGALLGPMPALPIFSAIPDGWGAAAALAPVLLAFVGVLAGVALGKVARRCSVAELASVVIVAAVVAGLVIALLSWLASGSLGPGRLTVVGPEMWLTCGLAAAELGVGGMIGAFAARADLARRAVDLAKVDRSPAPVEDTLPPVSAVPAAVPPISAPSDDPDDQLTEPLEFPTPVKLATREEQASNVVPVFAGDDGEDFEELDPDDQLTEEQPTLPAREPELFDNEAARAAQEARDLAAEKVKPAGPINEADPDADALIEAYSWDHIEEPSEEKRSNWRWPGRKG